MNLNEEAGDRHLHISKINKSYKVCRICKNPLKWNDEQQKYVHDFEAIKTIQEELVNDF